MAWLAASVLFAFVCDINAVSMHSYYRSRLAEAFMPEVGDGRRRRRRGTRCCSGSPISGGGGRALSDHQHDVEHHQLHRAQAARTQRREHDPDAAVLRFEPAPATGGRSNYLRGELTLSTAFSVSGAAVDPDTYATKSRAVSFLMTLLNVRLGIWVANPRHEPRRLRWPAWYLLMMREMLGVGLDEKDARIHLADGGHFENLGLYELLRRRCRYILVSDAGADPDATLADLGQAVQRARADLGADVDICADPLLHSGGPRNARAR